MKSENRAVLIIIVAVVVVVGIGAMYFLLTPASLPTTLPIPTGTAIRQFGYNVTFTVSGGPGRLVGAWYADHGGVIWVYPSDSPPDIILPCIIYGPWNGTADVSLAPGAYTILFNPGPPGNVPVGSFVITQPIRLVYPGWAPGVNRTILVSRCG
jgi:hypothetical protein